MGLFSKKKQSQPKPRPPGCGESKVNNKPGARPAPSSPSTGRQQGENRYPAVSNPSPVAFQPSGYLPLPPHIHDWNQARPIGPPPPAPYYGHAQGHYGPVIVNQHYYMTPPPLPAPLPPPPRPGNGSSCALTQLKLSSTADLINLPGNVINQLVDDGLPRWHGYGSQLLNQSAALYDQIWSKFDDVMTLIDGDKLRGDENELFMYQQPSAAYLSPAPAVSTHGPTSSKGGHAKRSKRDAVPKGQTTAVATSLAKGNYFAKVDLYANSSLPLDLPAFRITIPTYPLLCLAARYSERVYEKPQGAERDAHVKADWKTGAKAMYIKSVPMDKMGTIVFAIRGTASFMDWAVNLNTAPTAPTGFLDDARNFCHAGFLSVARKMISPVASRLRQLLEEDPGRCASSLLITGHSAGGAIASLLYMHMLATSKATSSELNLLTGCFKRIHCITFGAPPVSLFPLQTPDKGALKKSLFYSFVSEGDPVTRADKAYVKSLLELYAAPAPVAINPPKAVVPTPPSNRPQGKKSRPLLAAPQSSSSSKSSVKHSVNIPASTKPIWPVPPSTLSNAGRIIVLRSAKRFDDLNNNNNKKANTNTGNNNNKTKRSKTAEERIAEGVVAQVASDGQLRGLVWGDPVCHLMRLYAARIEALAVAAVTVKSL
ncbi:alpha/beta-hydrolase [Xylariaceae sp. FL0594]|nr:alpha/beta-hydrolase [Xylariaceae sp. FL0594]